MSQLVMMILLVALLALPVPARAADLDGWRFLQVSAADQVAVAKSPEGELRLVRAGDRLGESIKVAGFDEARVILEQPGEWGRITLFVDIADGRQRIARWERQPLRKSEVTGQRTAVIEGF